MTPSDETLSAMFEASRPRLHAIATRMLGSAAEADDVVQDAWLRANGAWSTVIDNVDGWLTTITSRLCLDVLRSRARASGRDDATVVDLMVPSPEEDAVLADAIGPALLVVLDALSPAERLAFVLHDLFAVPFDEVAVILGRSAAAARQLASRARRRVQGSVGADDAGDVGRQRPVVEAFLAAARTGDFGALVALLDPDAVFRADAEAAARGGATFVQGADAIAAAFVGKAQAASCAELDGVLSFVVAPGGRVLLIVEVAIGDDGRIVELDAVGAPARLAALGLT